jgi:hypothetical protein
MRPHVDRPGGWRKSRIRCMARLPNMGAAKFLAPNPLVWALALTLQMFYEVQLL